MIDDAFDEMYDAPSSSTFFFSGEEKVTCT